MPVSNNHGFANRFILSVLAIAFASGLGLMLAQRYFTGQSSRTTLDSVPLKSVRLIHPARTVPDFRLSLSDGTLLSLDTLRGHWTVVFLGFTHCPDVCPTTLTSLAQAQKLWDKLPANTRPQLLFVSVDPERDTPKIIGDYTHFFHPATLGATANEPELGDFAKALGLVYVKAPLPDGDYSIDHSSTLIVLDPQGRQAGLIRPPLVPLDIGNDLRLLSEVMP